MEREVTVEVFATRTYFIPATEEDFLNDFHFEVEFLDYPY